MIKEYWDNNKQKIQDGAQLGGGIALTAVDGLILAQKLLDGEPNQTETVVAAFGAVAAGVATTLSADKIINDIKEGRF